MRLSSTHSVEFPLVPVSLNVTLKISLKLAVHSPLWKLDIFATSPQTSPTTTLSGITVINYMFERLT